MQGRSIPGTRSCFLVPKMQLRCGSTLLDLTRPKVMGVLNVTPDSFSDGGRYASHARALEHAQAMIEAGAAIIDVGGESTRPGAPAVSVEEELRRVIPVVEQLARGGQAVVSVDTSTPEVILAAVAAGATLINDVRGLQRPGALEAAAASDCAVCVMHMQGEPQSMQQRQAERHLLEAAVRDVPDQRHVRKAGPEAGNKYAAAVPAQPKAAAPQG